LNPRDQYGHRLSEFIGICPYTFPGVRKEQIFPRFLRNLGNCCSSSSAPYQARRPRPFSHSGFRLNKSEKKHHAICALIKTVLVPCDSRKGSSSEKLFILQCSFVPLPPAYRARISLAKPLSAPRSRKRLETSSTSVDRFLSP
jgi:hypothetical protein